MLTTFSLDMFSRRMKFKSEQAAITFDALSNPFAGLIATSNFLDSFSPLEDFFLYSEMNSALR